MGAKNAWVIEIKLGKDWVPVGQMRGQKLAELRREGLGENYRVRPYRRVEPNASGGCPFCGSEDVVVAAPHFESEYFAECKNCGARSGIFQTPKGAEAAWKKRVTAMEGEGGR